MNIEDWSAVFLSGRALPAGRLSPSAEQILKQFPVWDGCYEKKREQDVVQEQDSDAEC